MEQNEFKVRCYEKGELAQLYFPNLDKRRAVGIFHKRGYTDACGSPKK